MSAAVVHVALPGHELRRAPARARETIARFLERTGWAFRLPTICVVNGEPVLRRDWRKVRIRAADNVAFVSRPLGGGRGGIKGILGLVAVIALAAFAPWAAGAIFGAGTIGASLATYGIVVGGDLCRDALAVLPRSGVRHGQ